MRRDTDRQAAGANAPAAGGSDPWVDWADRRDPPVYRVTIWPHRSLGNSGQKAVLAIAAIGLAVPLVPFFGTPVFWGILPFEAAALGFLWFGFRRNTFDGGLEEELTLWQDEMRVERREPRGRVLRWSAVPNWVRLTLHEEGEKVENYLTLRGGGREIELGAFLSPEERAALKDEIETALSRVR